jgi:hypothetical protein
MARDTSLLQAALLGYQAEAQRITAAIADLQQRLGKKGQATADGVQAPKKRQRRVISPEGRARIAEAQRRRWAAAKKK